MRIIAPWRRWARRIRRVVLRGQSAFPGATRAASARNSGNLAAIATTPEPAPIPNGRAAVWDLVIADMRARDEAGLATYGTRLQPFNGRDSPVDAYQEALDLCVYLRQAIEERRLRAVGQ